MKKGTSKSASAGKPAVKPSSAAAPAPPPKEAPPKEAPPKEVAAPPPPAKAKPAEKPAEKPAPAKAPPPVAKREEPIAAATILVLGGYGTVGSAVCRTLLEQSSLVKLLVAGRSLDRATAFCKQLNAEFPSSTSTQRASPRSADASDTTTLADCPRFDVIVNATTMSAVEGVITLMRLAASKRSHYLDLRTNYGLDDAVAAAVGDVGPIILMAGGFCPGAVTPLLEAAIGRLDKCVSAHLSIAATALPSQAEEAIEAMISGTRLEEWRGGKWQVAKPSQPGFGREADFFGDGRLRQTTPVGLAEVRALPEVKALNSCSVRFASTQDGGLLCAATAVLCCAPCVGLREGVAKHLRAAMERARAKEPSLCACVCEASGTDKEGKARKVVLRLSHREGPAAMTAHCVVAQLTQILTKDAIKGGAPPRLCGTQMNGEAFLNALLRQKVKCQIQTLDADASYDA